jgi:hypothetical protein
MGSKRLTFSRQTGDTYNTFAAAALFVWQMIQNTTKRSEFGWRRATAAGIFVNRKKIPVAGIDRSPPREV